MSKKLMPVIYVAGRFSDGGTLPTDEKHTNREILRDWSLKYMKAGWAVISPIENDEWASNKWGDEDDWYTNTLNADCAILERCDALFLCSGWEKSRGAVIEHEFAIDNDIPIFQEKVIDAKTWLAQQANVVDVWETKEAEGHRISGN